MSLLVAKADGVVPVSGDFTFDHPSVTEKQGPFWVSLQVSVHTDDPLAAGGFKVAVEYVDQVGETVLAETSAIALNATASKTNALGPFPLERLTDVSSLIFRTTLLGPAGDALVSYRVVMTPADSCDIQALYLIPV